jgi:hypothetical protein
MVAKASPHCWRYALHDPSCEKVSVKAANILPSEIACDSQVESDGQIDVLRRFVEILGDLR